MFQWQVNIVIPNFCVLFVRWIFYVALFSKLFCTYKIGNVRLLSLKFWILQQPFLYYEQVFYMIYPIYKVTLEFSHIGKVIVILSSKWCQHWFNKYCQDFSERLLLPNHLGRMLFNLNASVPSLFEKSWCQSEFASGRTSLKKGPRPKVCWYELAVTVDKWAS